MVSKLLGINKVGEHNRIVIPKDAMKVLGLCKGDHIVFLLDGEGGIRLQRMNHKQC